MSDTRQPNHSLIALMKACLQRPIAFHRVFADIAGSAVSGLFLSQAWYWQQRTTDQEGWWYKTQAEWEEETSLTRYEQENARMQLKRLRVLREKRKGVPAKLFYQLDLAVLQSRLLENHNLDWGKTTNKNVEKPQSIPEITSEILAEILSPPPIAPPGGHVHGKGKNLTPAFRKKKTYFPTDPDKQEVLRTMVLDTAFYRWVQEKGLTLDIAAQWESFRGKALANGYQYLDWRQAFMNWLTSPLQANGGPPKKTVQQKQEALRKWAEEEMQETRHGSR